MSDLFLRTKALVGQSAFERLQQAHVVVVGVGGVGGAALEALVRAGVGRVTVIDPDVFAPSNCNRQLLALASTVGRPKVQVAKERMLEINPQLTVTPLCQGVTPQNVGELLPAQVTYVADCIDDVPAKAALAACCKERGVPLLMCMGTGNRLSAEGLRVVNFDKTENCPLAKKMRLLLRKEGFSKVRCLYSAAPTVQVQPIDEAGKRTVGSISYVPPVAGYRMAEHIVQAVLNQQTQMDIPK